MKIGLLTILWVVLIAGAFWKFEGSYLLPVKHATGVARPAPAESVSKNLDLSAYRGEVVLVNFWNPNCACSEFAEPHVAHLFDEYSKKGVAFVTVVASDSESGDSSLAKAQTRHLPGKLVLDTSGAICTEFDVLAAPAAVVYDRSGKAVYRGSYNVARFCDDKATAYVEKTLESLVEGKGEVPKSLPFYGCHTTAAK